MNLEPEPEPDPEPELEAGDAVLMRTPRAELREQFEQAAVLQPGGSGAATVRHTPPPFEHGLGLARC